MINLGQRERSNHTSGRTKRPRPPKRWSRYVPFGFGFFSDHVYTISWEEEEEPRNDKGRSQPITPAVDWILAPFLGRCIQGHGTQYCLGSALMGTILHAAWLYSKTYPTPQVQHRLERVNPFLFPLSGLILHHTPGGNCWCFWFVCFLSGFLQRSPPSGVCDPERLAIVC